MEKRVRLGTARVVGLFVFCYLRTKWPETKCYCSTSQELYTSLPSQDQFRETLRSTAQWKFKIQNKLNFLFFSLHTSFVWVWWSYYFKLNCLCIFLCSQIKTKIFLTNSFSFIFCFEFTLISLWSFTILCFFPIVRHITACMHIYLSLLLFSVLMEVLCITTYFYVTDEGSSSLIDTEKN